MADADCGFRRAAFGWIPLILLSACSSQAKKAEAELATLAAWLPGRYDNVEQLRGDATRQPVVLQVVPFYGKPLGKAAFYLYETAADDPRRVLSQRIIAFDVDPKGKRIVEAVFSLVEPGRWRDAHLNPDLFTGLIPHEDLRPMAGCGLVWKREGERFVGANEKSSCRATSRVTGATVNVEMRAEASPGELAFGERAFDPAGRQVEGDAEGTLMRYTKRGE
jgi:CpeT/CpcT family (DUF1001)